jgi:hypothetical protein
MRIEREWVEFKAVSDSSGSIIELVKLQLDHLSLPPDASLVIEVRTTQRRVRRFAAGTISSPALGIPFQLNEPTAEGVSIDLKVVRTENTQRGKILAICKGLRPLFGGQHESLLVIVRKDLGQRIWNLNLDPEYGPVLELNINFGDPYMVWNNQLFLGLTMPAIVKTIAIWLVDNQDAGEDDPIGPVVKQWKSLFESWGYLVSNQNSEDVDEVQHWADGIAEAFSNKYSYFSSVSSSFGMDIE